jgi:hypothetical protein
MPPPLVLHLRSLDRNDKTAGDGSLKMPLLNLFFIVVGFAWTTSLLWFGGKVINYLEAERRAKKYALRRRIRGGIR